MISLSDSQSEVIQKIKYKLEEIKLYNRNFIPSDQNFLGYSKELKSDIAIDRLYDSVSILNRKTQTSYVLNWDLFLEYEKYLSLVSIVEKYYNDIKFDINNSLYLYIPSVPSSAPLILEDNKIKDFFSNSYKSYNIIITEISGITELFFDKEMVKLSIVGETV
jgi:hypothetical protein